MMNNYPELTYSFSKAKMLDECERRYFYNYYESNGGWRNDASQKTKIAYRLKKLQPLQAIVGEAIHSAITAILMDSTLAEKDFRRLVNQRIRENYRKSLSSRIEWMGDPKLFSMVQEVYYGGDVTEQVKDQVIAKINQCTQNLNKCFSLQEIQADASIISLDELKEMDMFGITAYVKIDMLYKTSDDRYVVVDWKTGKGGSIDVEQLLVYVYFTHKMFDIPIEKIEAMLEYLVDGDCAIYRFTANDMNMAERTIVADIRQMNKFLFDIDRNIPLPEMYFQANPSAKCKQCNFQELCNVEPVIKHLDTAKEQAVI